MDKTSKQGASAPVDDLDNSRSQVVFIAVGIGIILGGLWLLYDADGPYHPGDSEADAHIQVSTDS